MCVASYVVWLNGETKMAARVSKYRTILSLRSDYNLVSCVV
uniref:Uncharacterized protein n=1 Tax=Anguilla anguilla TaxID=7936 RepID=A0A0E9SSA6_ANGAN